MSAVRLDNGACTIFVLPFFLFSSPLIAFFLRQVFESINLSIKYAVTNIR